MALDNSPGVAQEVGVLLSAFAVIELSPPHILARLTGMKKADADITLGHFRNFSNRLDLIQAIALTREEDDPDRREALSLLADIRACNTIRNKYAHGLWSGVGPNTFQLSSWLTDATRESVATIVTPETIREDCAVLRATLHRAINYEQIVVATVQPKERGPSIVQRLRASGADRRSRRKQPPP